MWLQHKTQRDNGMKLIKEIIQIYKLIRDFSNGGHQAIILKINVMDVDSFKRRFGDSDGEGHSDSKCGQ